MSSRSKSPSRASRTRDAEDVASWLEGLQFDSGILVSLPEGQLMQLRLEWSVSPWC
jgi:hypothetical protein